MYRLQLYNYPYHYYRAELYTVPVSPMSAHQRPAAVAFAQVLAPLLVLAQLFPVSWITAMEQNIIS